MCFKLLLSLFIAGCGLEGVSPPVEGESRHEERIKGFTFTESDGASKVWELAGRSARLERSGEKDRIHIYDFEVEFFQEGEDDTLLEASRGVFIREDRIFYTEGDVLLLSGDRKIETSDIKWDPRTGGFETSRRVKITTPDGIIRGRGMTASRDLREIHLKEEITGDISG